METLTPLVVLHQVYEDTIDSIHWKNEWMDTKEDEISKPYGAVYFNRPLRVGQVIKTRTGRKTIAIIIGLPVGNAVLFPRASNKGDQSVIGCFPAELHSIYSGMLKGLLPLWLVKVLLGYGGHPNIGTLMNNDPAGNNPGFFRCQT